MRIWKGKEKEGRYVGLNTLFIETAELSLDKLILLVNVLNNDDDIQAIYLGAGKIDLENFTYSLLDAVLAVCNSKKLKITIEFEFEYADIWTAINTLNILLKHDILLVIRHSWQYVVPKQLLEKIVYKIDDGSNVYITDFKKDYHTSLEMLKDSLYVGTDTILYEGD